MIFRPIFWFVAVLTLMWALTSAGNL